MPLHARTSPPSASISLAARAATPGPFHGGRYAAEQAARFPAVTQSWHGIREPARPRVSVATPELIPPSPPRSSGSSCCLPVRSCCDDCAGAPAPSVPASAFWRREDLAGVAADEAMAREAAARSGRPAIAHLRIDHQGAPTSNEGGPLASLGVPPAVEAFVIDALKLGAGYFVGRFAWRLVFGREEPPR